MTRVPPEADGTARSDGAPSTPTPRSTRTGDHGHVPVLAERVVALLTPALGPDTVVVDGTVGMGGHAEALLAATADPADPARVAGNPVLVGIDRDPAALAISADRLARFGERVRLVHAVNDDPADALRQAGVASLPVAGILLDLGVSSLQLDDDDRGFSYARDTPLDMRMDPTTGIDAAGVLNTYPVEELTRVLRTFGEERYAPAIARGIVAARRAKPFRTSRDLVDVVVAAYPRPRPGRRESGGHPAKKTFQALRIEVNGELDALSRVLDVAVDLLADGGRIAVLAYHSGEDRRVKQAFAAAARPDVPDGVPVVPLGRGPKLELLTRGAEKAPEDEVAANPRASSARLRAAQRMPRVGAA